MRRHLLVRFALAMLAAASAVGTTSPSASAHTTIKGANPTAGEHVTEPIDRLEIEFFVPVSEPIITLTAPSGQTLPGTVSMTNADALAYEVSPLVEAGEYIVEWSVVTPDGHRDAAAYSFDYEPDDTPEPGGQLATALLATGLLFALILTVALSLNRSSSARLDTESE